MNIWKVCFWGWALCSASAVAQEVHRFPQGRDVAYRAAPCTGNGTHGKWRLAVHPQAVARRTTSRGGARRASEGRRARGAGKASHVRQEAGGSCEAVRARRAAAYEAAGLKRDFAMSSLWDNRVQQACK